MKPKRKFHSRNEIKPVKIRRAPGTPTKSQLKSVALAEARAVRIRWKTLIGDARITWTKLQPEELAKVDGDVSVLAGLVQMRYQLGRVESDRQVKAFFEKHPLPTPVVQPAPVSVAAIAVTLQ